MSEFEKNGHLPHLAGALLIEKERAWKRVTQTPFEQMDPRSFWPGTRQIVGVKFPHGIWLMKILAVRSDGFNITMAVTVTTETFMDPRVLGMALHRHWEQLEAFRNCECQNGMQCEKHAPNVVQARPGPRAVN